MSLRRVSANRADELWATMADRFLTGVKGNSGPSGFSDHLWLRDRQQRDRLLEAAYARGCRGWLGTPFGFWTQLPERFDIRGRPIGLLTRRALISRIGREVAEQCGFTDPRRGPAIVRGHMLDRVFSDMLPEGVGPDQLAAGLEKIAHDDFAERRNAWVVGTYRAYLEALDEMGRVDLRSVPARLADAIDDGALPSALDGADQLHVYGLLYDLRSRRRFVRSLIDQNEVEVHVYALNEPEPGPWEALDVPTEDTGSDSAPMLRVQPAPDPSTEANWVAAQVKEILVAGMCEPHEIAVVARSGREDTRTVATALTEAGVPVSVRSRASLAEIGALKAFVGLFEGAADGWGYRSLRARVASPYFNMRVKVRSLDFLARHARVSGLETWRASMERLFAQATDTPKVLYGTGLFVDQLEKDLDSLYSLESELAWLSESRSEREWVERSLAWLREGPFHFRKRLCEPVGEEWDVVRFDQRGVLQLEKLLREWLDLADDGGSVSPLQWHQLLHRLLTGSELALSSPMDKGVQVLEAQDAALTPFRHMFVVHANHGEFPREVTTGGVFSDEERAALASHGLPIVHRADQARRERSLWRSVTSGADVTVLYRTTTFEGTPLLPSLMVPSHPLASELPRTRLPRWAAVTAAQHRSQAARELASGSDATTTVSVEHRDRLRQSVLAAYAEDQRPGTDAVRDDHPGLDPNPWNGGLEDPEVLAILAEEFGPARVWSASQLEMYGGCPFIFFLRRVLKIEESGVADEQPTALTFGGVAHEILERFYRQVKDDLPPAMDARTGASLTAATHTVLSEREGSNEWLGDPILWRNTRAEIEAVVRNYVTWELGHMAAKDERPVEIEFSFGFDGAAAVELTGPDRAGALQTLRLRGRIDRVDLTTRKGKPVHLVLDYKSSNVPAAKGYKDGSLLQTPLYVEILNTLDFQAVEGRYRALKKPGTPQNGAAAKTSQAVYAQALAHAMSVPARVRAGLFEPVMAPSKDWAPYHPGPEITRSRTALPADRERTDG